MAATERLFDFTRSTRDGSSVVEEMTTIRDTLDNQEEYSTYLYINTGHILFRMFWLHGRLPLDHVKDAAYVIMMMGFWKRDFNLRSSANANFDWGADVERSLRTPVPIT